MNGPCLCGDPYCPSCGRAQGTYPERPEADPDQLHDRMVQEEIDAKDQAPAAGPDPTPLEKP